MTNVFDLSSKTCLVTGGSRGLGYEMARTLGQAGARVVITARKRDELEDARAALVGLGIEAFAYVNDLGQIEDAEQLAPRIVDEIGPIDVLVNNAGTTWGGEAATVEWRHWKKVVDVNLNGTWALTQGVAKASMLPRKQGSIIMIASVGGIGAQPPGVTPTPAYHATKAAQINLMRALASEWGAHGIRVNAVLPGWFETKMAQATIEGQGHALTDRIPLGRVGDPAEDIGGPVLFLASEASRYVTGHALVVDGGMTAVL